MTYTKPQQKLVSFTDNPEELLKITDDMKEGWSIISLIRNGCYYVGIMELNSNKGLAEDSLFIPARKKIKILS